MKFGNRRSRRILGWGGAAVAIVGALLASALPAQADTVDGNGIPIGVPDVTSQKVTPIQAMLPTYGGIVLPSSQNCHFGPVSAATPACLTLPPDGTGTQGTTQVPNQDYDAAIQGVSFDPQAQLWSFMPSAYGTVTSTRTVMHGTLPVTVTTAQQVPEYRIVQAGADWINLDQSMGTSGGSDGLRCLAVGDPTAAGPGTPVIGQTCDKLGDPSANELWIVFPDPDHAGSRWLINVASTGSETLNNTPRLSLHVDGNGKVIAGAGASIQSPAGALLVQDFTLPWTDHPTTDPFAKTTWYQWGAAYAPNYQEWGN